MKLAEGSCGKGIERLKELLTSALNERESDELRQPRVEFETTTTPFSL